MTPIRSPDRGPVKKTSQVRHPDAGPEGELQRILPGSGSDLVDQNFRQAKYRLNFKYS